MIRELSNLGKKLRKKEAGKKIIHDALKEEPVSIDLIIKEDGTFERFETIEKITRPAEAITAKKGKARFLLDKAEEVLCYYTLSPKNKNEQDKKEKAAKFKHSLFIEKLNEYRHLPEIKSVFAFYEKNKAKGFDKAVSCFEKQIKEKERNGNIAFRIRGKDIRIHEEPAVYQSIIEKYEAEQATKNQGESKKCSVCGENKYPVEDVPHGMIKRIPDGQSSGCALVSYNENAFESFDLKGNMNSAICSNCARTYVEGLSWLLSNGNETSIVNKKGKEEIRFKYSNRKNFGADTAMVFWTRENQKIKEMDFLEAPDEGEVANLIDSVANAKTSASKIKPDQFYSCTLSGAAARIAVRDWIETSLFDLKRSIAEWFKDIAIDEYNFTEKKTSKHYSSLYSLAGSCQRKISNNKKDDKDVTFSRVSSLLWNAALKGNTLPVWILSSVLKRIKVDEEGVSPVRAALIKLILNRNNKGGNMLQEGLDVKNNGTAYICGRLFAVMESIQRAALGKNINAGIRERYFSFASTNPSPAFGRLCKMSQNHLTKLKGDKPGLAVVLDKELQELFSNIKDFPAVFSLEEQGRFAIGYYHQKQYIFTKVKDKPELLESLEETNL